MTRSKSSTTNAASSKGEGGQKGTCQARQLDNRADLALCPEDRSADATGQGESTGVQAAGTGVSAGHTQEGKHTSRVSRRPWLERPCAGLLCLARGQVRGHSFSLYRVTCHPGSSELLSINLRFQVHCNSFTKA